MSIWNLKIRKFKSDFRRGKRLKNFMVEKASPPSRNLVIFSKKGYNKKTLTSDASIEVTNILSLKIRKFKSDFLRGKRLKDFFTENASAPHRNLVILSKKWFQKTMISFPKTWKKLKVQKWYQKASRSL